MPLTRWNFFLARAGRPDVVLNILARQRDPAAIGQPHRDKALALADGSATPVWRGPFTWHSSGILRARGAWAFSLLASGASLKRSTRL